MTPQGGRDKTIEKRRIEELNGPSSQLRQLNSSIWNQLILLGEQ
jgi:hypothetical protein